MNRHTAKPGVVVSIDSGGHRARVLARRDQLFNQYVYLVRPIAERIAFTLPPCFDLDDLIQTGNLGLLAAATRYRPSAHNGTPFDAFARKYIRGTILDSVRRRHYTENTRPSIDEPISIRGNPEQTVVLRDRFADTSESVEVAIDRERQKCAILQFDGFQGRLSRAHLSDQQAAVIAAYYSPSQPTLAAVAAHLGIAEWRAARAHTEALAVFRRVLKAA